MKNLHFATLAAALAILIAGCDKKSDTANPPASDTNAASTDATAAATNAWQKTVETTTNVLAGITNSAVVAWTDIKESLGSATDYTYDKKDEFVTKAQSDLDSLDQKIQSMADKADASLHEKRAALDQKLTDAKNATQDTWNSARDSFMSAYNDVKDSVKQAWSGSSTNSAN